VYVCYCHAVTTREVEAAVDHGAESVEAVGDETGAGTGCGGCHPTIEELIQSRCGACPRRIFAVA
jgi:NAD(P)H-nitrite reductase large subunit